MLMFTITIYEVHSWQNVLVPPADRKKEEAVAKANKVLSPWLEGVGG